MRCRRCGGEDCPGGSTSWSSSWAPGVHVALRRACAPAHPPTSSSATAKISPRPASTTGVPVMPTCGADVAAREIARGPRPAPHVRRPQHRARVGRHRVDGVVLGARRRRDRPPRGARRRPGRRAPATVQAARGRREGRRPRCRHPSPSGVAVVHGPRRRGVDVGDARVAAAAEPAPGAVSAAEAARNRSGPSAARATTVRRRVKLGMFVSGVMAHRNALS